MELILPITFTILPPYLTPLPSHPYTSSTSTYILIKYKLPFQGLDPGISRITTFCSTTTLSLPMLDCGNTQFLMWGVRSGEGSREWGVGSGSTP
jgi:hypothetical protein